MNVMVLPENIEIASVPAAPSTLSTKHFGLPKDYRVYISQIHEKVNNLIFHGIWSGIDKMKLKQWLKNFETEEEKYFAACLMDNLIYRNNAQTESLLFNLISIDIPNLILKHKPVGIYPFATLDGFRSSVDPGIRLVCVKSEFDSPSKSSHFVARMLKRKMLIQEGWMITPDQIDRCVASGVKCFIFIDDFLGTGEQFDNTATEIQLNNKIAIPDLLFAYAPLAAHAVGINHLTSEYPGLKITYVEKLDESNSLFNSAFNDGINTPEIAREFYLQFMRKKSGNHLTNEILLGFGQLELTYAFEEAIPDNNLPIIYWNADPTINSLFDR